VRFWCEFGMSRGRILAIDDHSANRAVVRGLLGRRGFEVLEAADGAEGLRLLYAEKPELVLLDVTMPELDGWETLARIRALTASR